MVRVSDEPGAWYINGDGADRCAVCSCLDGPADCREHATLWRLDGDGVLYHVCEQKMRIVARGAEWATGLAGRGDGGD